MATVTVGGNTVNLSGKELNVGDNAPEVEVVGKDLKPLKVGGSSDKVQIIVTVPSLDTAVCATETRKFNQNIASLKDSKVVVVSMDLPFAMGRFCSTEGIENLEVGSDFRNKELATKYGVLIADGALAGLSARAIFVVDKSGKVAYKEVVSEVTTEPDYDAIKEAVEKL